MIQFYRETYFAASPPTTRYPIQTRLFSRRGMIDTIFGHTIVLDQMSLERVLVELDEVEAAVRRVYSESGALSSYRSCWERSEPSFFIRGKQLYRLHGQLTLCKAQITSIHYLVSTTPNHWCFSSSLPSLFSLVEMAAVCSGLEQLADEREVNAFTMAD